MYAERLKEMKKRKNITASEIAAKSGIPESTVSRILNGQTENPTFVTIAAIVKAMDGSLDELAGIDKPEPEKQCCTINEDYIGSLKEKISDLKDETNHRRKVITMLIIILFAFVITVLIVTGLFLWYDITHGNVGFFFRDMLSNGVAGMSFL